jgi:hypothetical protein
MRLLDKSLRTAWLIVLLTLVATSVLGTGLREGPWRLGMLGLGVLGALCWIFVTFRMLRFHRGLHRFIRRLLASDYETGIRVGSMINDDLSEDARMCTRLAEQLRTYDVLRANRVSLTHRALDVVLESAGETIFLYDVPKQALRINEPLQELLGSDKFRFSADTLREIAGNAPFFRVLDGIVAQERTDMQADTRLRLPGSHADVAIRIRFVPLKGHRENVDMVVGFVSRAAAVSFAPAPAS